jgi:GNAT superfamily N-acetyltransferase
MVEVRRIRVDEGQRLKAIRLQALADAPEAFGTTLAEAKRHRDDYWEDLAERGAHSDALTIVVAEDGEAWLGMARGFWESERPDEVDFVSLWVDPTRRRTGIAANLLGAVAQWARGRGAKRLQLWVTETNVPAKSLYLRLGFAETGETAPHPSIPSLREVQMIREL